ncbi:MAG: thiamine phosphate synthase [Candidatus Ancaeobacter aquaticus]|nr:thiamine phosphate synthase [Candidatus Ancaeobacter aquaticus]
MKDDIGLYVIIDQGYLGKKDPVKYACRVIDAGVKIIQYRAKDSRSSDYVKNAIAIARIAKKRNVKFIVNDRVDIALWVNADGVHLGADDIPAVAARKLLGSKKIIGYSTHSVREATLANKLPIDYISIGPIYYSKTKNVVHPLGCESVRKVVQRVTKPVVAIGGVDDKNVQELYNAGASGISVISYVLGAHSMKHAVEKINKGKINPCQG